MSQRVLVTFEAIASAQQSVAKTAANLDQKLADLKSMLQPLVQTWTGSASDLYQQKQAQWDTSQQDLNQVLMQIGKVLGVAHDAYTQAETANAKTWS
jgi:early secretory antigenic target protein ESAT-6